MTETLVPTGTLVDAKPKTERQISHIMLYFEKRKANVVMRIKRRCLKSPFKGGIRQPLIGISSWLPGVNPTCRRTGAISGQLV